MREDYNLDKKKLCRLSLGSTPKIKIINNFNNNKTYLFLENKKKKINSQKS